MHRLAFLLLLSLSLFTSQSFSIITHLRDLQQAKATDKEKACSNLPEGYEGNKQYNSLNAFVESLNIKPSAGRTFLLDLIIHGTVTNLSDFVIEIWVYILMIVLGAIALITWPIMCCCCCCNCGVFNDNKAKNCCGTVNLIIAIIFLALIIVSSVVGLSHSNPFVEYFNGSLCSLYTFLDNTLTGENTQEVPRWGGAKGINQSLKVTLDSIVALKENTFAIPSTETTSRQKAYEALINSNEREYTFQSPDGTGAAQPVYGLQFKDQKDTTTSIGYIAKEKTEIIDASVTTLNQLNDVFVQVKKNNEMEGKIRAIRLLLTTFQSLVESLSKIVADNIGLIQAAYSDILLLIFQILFGIYFIIAVATLTLLLIYTCCKCYCFKVFIHVFWNFLFLYTVLSFIIGFFFGIIGVIGLQTIPVLNYVFSEAFLNSPDSPFGSQEGAQSLSTCINGDGDLATALGLTSSDASLAQLNTLIQLSIAIDEIKTSLGTVSDSIALPAIQKTMEGYSNDIDSTSTKYREVTNGINTDLNECSPNARVYVNAQSHNAGDIEITETTPTTYPCPPSPPSTDYYMRRRIEAVKESIKSNMANINGIIASIGTMKTGYSETLKLIQSDLSKAFGVTNNFTIAFADVIGGNSLFTMFNCKFIRYDLINFVDQFGNKFSSSSDTIGICCFVCSFASFIGVFFLMSSIYYFSETARENTQRTNGFGLNESPGVEKNAIELPKLDDPSPNQI